MTPSIKAAGGLLNSLGCTDISFAESTTSNVARMAATHNDKKIVVRVQTKAEWGTDCLLKSGHNWADPRYPYKSVQFGMPQPGEPVGEYTHFFLVSGCATRIVMAPKAAIDSSDNGWIKEGDRYTQTAVVVNWTPKVSFFVRTDEGWVTDDANVWNKPVSCSMDADEFLASL
jgi:hypothetical protein